MAITKLLRLVIGILRCLVGAVKVVSTQVVALVVVITHICQGRPPDFFSLSARDVPHAGFEIMLLWTVLRGPYTS